MANNNPDFHGGVTQDAPAILGEGTPVKRVLKEMDWGPEMHKQLSGKAMLEEHDLGRSSLNSSEDESLRPGEESTYGKGEASVGAPECWFPVSGMRMSSEIVPPTISGPQEGGIPKGGNQLREENPGAYFDEPETLPTREGFRSRGGGHGSFGPGSEPSPGPQEPDNQRAESPGGRMISAMD